MQQMVGLICDQSGVEMVFNGHISLDNGMVNSIGGNLTCALGIYI